MILDLDTFLGVEHPFWRELEELLELMSRRGGALDVKDAKRLHYLYERTSEDLVKIATFSGERETRARLENLVSRAYSLTPCPRRSRTGFSITRFILADFPVCFRRNVNAFAVSSLSMLVGAVFGAFALWLMPDAKDVLIPPEFAHLRMTPEERVKMEESGSFDRLEGGRSAFAAYLATHNIKVSLAALSLGVTFGVGTVLLMFYNGILLGAVVSDFAVSGYWHFVTGWLLPHGAVEIPAILIAGQAGIVLASALLRPGGAGRRNALKARLPDITILAGGFALMLLWAGLVESFFSQYHWPLIPYPVKITFGVLELFILAAYLAFAGRPPSTLNTESRLP